LANKHQSIFNIIESIHTYIGYFHIINGEKKKSTILHILILLHFFELEEGEGEKKKFLLKASKIVT